MHASIPCSPWSAWTYMNLHRLGRRFKTKLLEDRKQSLVMLHHVKILARAVNSLGGKFSFEWPRYSRGWNLKELQSFIAKFSIPHVDSDGCSLGLKSSKGIPIKKPWRIITTSNRLIQNLHDRKCSGGHTHQICAGSDAKRSASYTNDNG